MKLRVLPIVIALFASCALLFGGWFMFRSYAMENPLAKLVNGIQGVETVDSSFSNGKVTLNLELNKDASVRDIYRQVSESGVANGRKVQLNVKSESSPELDKWWSTVLFDIAQAMETRHYSDIPVLLQEKSKKLQGMTAETEMDDQNVYIRLTSGESSKYIILPRVPAGLGVWPNE